MKQGRIKGLKALAETKFLSTFDASYENRMGDEKHWVIASRKSYDALKDKYFNGGSDTVDAVVIAAYHEEYKKLVIEKQFRVPVNDFIYELPAGLVDPGEDPRKTAVRELKEETGLEVVNVNEKMGINMGYQSPGMTDESIMLVYCTCRGEISKNGLEDDEDIHAFMVSQDEAEEILKSGEKMDMKFGVILQSFVLLGEKLFY